MLYTVAVPDLHIRGGGGHPDPEIRGEPSLQKVFFRSAFRASIWLDCEQSLFFFRFSESNARAWPFACLAFCSTDYRKERDCS